MKAIEMRLVGVPVKEVMEQLGIRNKTQLKTWMRWYRKGERHRLEQPVGKQYSYGKGPEHSSELDKIKAENRFLKQQLDLLKKYGELEPEVTIAWIESIRDEVTVLVRCFDPSLTNGGQSPPSLEGSFFA